jgi:hypothetical protein
MNNQNLINLEIMTILEFKNKYSRHIDFENNIILIENELIAKYTLMCGLRLDLLAKLDDLIDEELVKVTTNNKNLKVQPMALNIFTKLVA